MSSREQTPSPLVGEALQAALSACDREPIHVPGAIQPHGILLVLDGDAVIRQMSANAPRFLAVDAEDVLGRTAHEVLGEDASLRIAQARTAEPNASNPMRVGRLATGPPGPFEILVHPHPHGCIVEIEPEADQLGDLAAFRWLRDSLMEIEVGDSIPDLLDLSARAIARLTGYARVMVYRFHPDFSGEVVAEAITQDGLEPYLGLRYPATDIPVQARRLYETLRIRLIPHVDYAAAELVPPLWPDGHDLDMSDCTLRSVSPVHLQYLRNMGVGATLTISILQDGRLWGLIACHHTRAHRVSHNVRNACEMISQVVARSVRLLGERDRAREATRLARLTDSISTTMVGAPNLLDAVTAASGDLLDLVGADGVVVSIDHETRALGVTPPDPALSGIIAALQRSPAFEPVAVTSLVEALPEFDARPTDIAGVLLLPLAGAPGDHVCWFRREEVTTVRWAGAPAKDGETLVPRASFAEWVEIQKGRCAPWSDLVVSAAEDLGRRMAALMLSRLRERMVRMGRTDELTGLPNRQALINRIAHLAEQGSVGVAMIDLDRFHLINEALGYEVGHDSLVRIADRLQTGAGTHDVYRFTGDTFVVVHPDADEDALLESTERLLGLVRQPLTVRGRRSVLTASAGIATTRGGLSADELLGAAETATHEAKRRGRDRSAVFSDNLQLRASAALDTEQALRRARRAGEFMLHYQPIAGADGVVVGLEALVRWNRPGVGLVPPAEFLPVAEETGLMIDLGEWVILQALADIQRLDMCGAGGLWIAVNVTAQHLTTPGFAPLVAAELAARGVPPSRLRLEITESGLVERYAVAAGVLEQLERLGVGVAIDDFGTGFSSLAHAHRLPVMAVKLDRSFLAELHPADGRAAAVLQAVVVLAKGLHMTLIAEGIETREQFEAAKDLGCNLFQGYLLGRPVPFEDLVLAGSGGGGAGPR